MTWTQPAVEPPRDEIKTRAPEVGLDLTNFPAKDLPGGATWFRGHASKNGPWYFSSSGGGRFDLSAPAGTCYLATTAEAATREVIGADLMKSKYTTEAFVQARIVSTLQLPAPVKAAKTTVDCTSFALLGSELAHAVDYTVSHAWAAALHMASFEAIWYSPRFSGPDPRALALFDDAGARKTWARDSKPEQMLDVVRRMGVTVEVAPTDPALIERVGP